MKSAMSLNTINATNYCNVVLKNSLWKRQMDSTIEMYLNIPDDDLLHIYRIKAGLESEAQGLTGWYGAGASTFGQKLAAFAKMYLVTGDYRLKEKAVYLADEWTKCVDLSDKVLENDTYVYDKLMGGLLDLYEHLGYKKALLYISKLTDYAISHFARDIKRDGLQDASLCERKMIEWYTLPENLYRAYLFTEDEKYRSFAKEWDYDYFWDKLNSKDFHFGARHAYSHVNCLSSAARAYRDTGEERYLSAMKIAYDEIMAHHMFVTGGYGPAECIFSENEGYLGDSLKSSWDKTLNGEPTFTNFAGGTVARSDAWGSSEISCCAWAAFKFCNYMLQYTGEAKYADWVEKLLYNGTGGQLPIEPDGKVMYYASYFVDGALKTVEDRRIHDGGQAYEWQCCTGTFPQDLAEYANMLYYSDENGIYVSQYLPSLYKWKKGNTVVNIENYSLYPEESQVKLRISIENSVRFNLKLRVPSWATEKNCLKLNGKLLKLELVPNQWVSIDRIWNDSDMVTLDFPYTLRFKAVDEKNPDIVALSYGPFVLVTDRMTYFIGDIEQPTSWIHPVEGGVFHFITDKGHVAGYDFLTRTFTPYYKVGSMQWYYMYNRIKPA
jgi:uncharacterized protein